MFSLRYWLVVLLLLRWHVSDASLDASSVVRQISTRRAKVTRTETGKNVGGTGKKATNVGGPCRWDAAAATCVVGYGPIADTFGSSSNAYAQLVAQFARCSAITDAETCTSTSKCSWSTDSLTCHFLDFFTGHEDSPCATEASSFLTTLVAQETCTLHKTQLSCYKDPLCSWEEEIKACSFDNLVSYIGVSLEQVAAASQTVVPFKVDELKKVFPSYFNTTAKDFEWKDILDWDVPMTGCPEWSDPLICTYTDGVLSSVAQSFYCGALYSSPDDRLRCTLDPLCFIEPNSGRCEQPEDTFLPGVYKGIKDIVSTYVEGALDRKILLQLFECSEMQTEDTCKDPCIWNHAKTADTESGECAVRGMWISRTIADSGDESDAFCKMWGSLARSKCVDITDPQVCDAEPDCTSLLSGHCWMSVDNQAMDVTKADSDLKAAYDKLGKACSSYETEEACQTTT